ADYLGEESRTHFEAVQTLLSEAGIDFQINHRLVRGLDYYNRTVFEWVSDRLGAQGTVCAGGRYDALVGQLGGKPMPAAGFAMGMERLLALWQESGEVEFAVERPLPDVYVVYQGDRARCMAFCAAETLRDVGFDVLLHCGGGSFKSQMRKADASGALLALIIGEDEAATGEVGIKPLRGTDEQHRVPFQELAEAVANAIYGTETPQDNEPWEENGKGAENGSV
ncbi:MAG: histidine--tRNA ligase, partial [Azoarcus sp.]|nr:histidine--tRNA ligase [Azoarcus sp.]